MTIVVHTLSSYSSTSSDYVIPLDVSKDKYYNKNENEKINALDILRSNYINETSSDYNECTQVSIDNTPTNTEWKREIKKKIEWQEHNTL
jgi:hypothetical protein